MCIQNRRASLALSQPATPGLNKSNSSISEVTIALIVGSCIGLLCICGGGVIFFSKHKTILLGLAPMDSPTKSIMASVISDMTLAETPTGGFQDSEQRTSVCAHLLL